MEKKSYVKFFSLYNLYSGIVISHIENVIRELYELQLLSKNKKKQKKQKIKEDEWADDLNKQITKRNEKDKNFQATIKRKIPTSFIGKFIILQIIRIVTNKHKKRLEKMISTLNK